MAQVTVRETFTIDGVLTNMTSVTFNGAAITPSSAGVYKHTFTGLTGGTTFAYTVVYVCAGVTYSDSKTVDVPADSGEESVGEGTITKAEILTEVNANTLFAETDIDRSIITVLLDISTRGGFLKTYATGTWAVNADHIDISSDFLALDLFEYDDEEIDEGTLGELVDDSQELYAVRGKSIYLMPIPTTAKAYTIHYTQTHPNNADSILFGESFRECIVAGVTAKRFEAKQQFDSANYYRNLYEQKLSGLIDKIPYQPIICRMRKGFRE